MTRLAANTAIVADTTLVDCEPRRTDGPGRGVDWRSGEQQLSGPYEPSAFPLDLVLD